MAAARPPTPGMDLSIEKLVGNGTNRPKNPSQMIDLAETCSGLPSKCKTVNSRPISGLDSFFGWVSRKTNILDFGPGPGATVLKQRSCPYSNQQRSLNHIEYQPGPRPMGQAHGPGPWAGPMGPGPWAWAHRPRPWVVFNMVQAPLLIGIGARPLFQDRCAWPRPEVKNVSS